VDCGNWGVSASWAVPATAVSGVYFARIYGGTDNNAIPFVITNSASTSDIIYSTSDETWQAYNNWGRWSLYVGSSTGSPWCCSAYAPGRAVQVSYNRPFANEFNDQEDYFFYAEFPMIEWMEQNGYNVTYVSQSDLSGSGGAVLLEQHKIFTMSGHSEYFDAGDRTALTAARNAGVNMAFFSGNLMWWKTRWAASQYGNEASRTLITYKESADSVQDDPADPPTWTGNWRDARFVTSGDDSDQPENALTGQLWMVNCCDPGQSPYGSWAEQVQAQYAQDLIWRNTAVASLQSGQTYSMPAQTLGYEWDEDLDNGHRPAGEIDMSKTCANVTGLLLTADSQTGPGYACNSLTLYRAAGGALVFDAGTVQWSWGLSSGIHDGNNNGTDAVMQQATVNLFAMMNVQPATLMTGLVAGVTPHDTAPPTSTITAPAPGTAIGNGSTVTVSGTATDSGGGVVAGVEVSTDGGSTWHPVTTMSAAATSVQWSYTWYAAGLGHVTILSRATDDDANTETPGTGVTVTVSCPCGLFGTNYVPTTTSTPDSGAYELGVKFESSVTGWVAGVRFYKGAGNNGTHTGSLWSAAGALLATGTFTGESASGWQTLNFASPVQIAANTIYVASYYDPDGNYASELDRFDTALDTPPLSAAAANYVTGVGNGVFNVGGPGFPTQAYASIDYGVDVIFDTTQPAGPPVPSATSAASAVLSDTNGILAVYAVRSDGNVWSDVQLSPGGAFSGWLPLSTTGNFTGTPAVVETGSGEIGIYARTTSGAVMGASESAPGGEHLSWITIGTAGNLVSSPTQLLTKSGLICLYEPSSGGAMEGICQRWAGGPFSSWQVLSGNLGFAGRPAVLQTPSGIIAIYARTNAGAIDGTSQRWVGGPFESWGIMGTTAGLVSDPTALLTASGAIALFAADSGGAIAESSQSFAGGPFRTWQALPGGQGFTGRPAVLQASAGTISVYASTPAGTVLGISQPTGGAFGSWGQIGTASDLISEPTAVFTTSGLAAIFASDSAGGISWISQSTVGGPFGSWAGT